MYEIQETRPLAHYAELFRNMVNSAVQNRDESIKSALRLNDSSDWNFITTAMDVVEDALEALHNFLRFGTGGPTRIDDIGERYLRLYGLLSAVYIQQEAILELYKRMNVPNPKAQRAKFDALELRQLRHKIASHSTAFLDTDKTKQTFVPIRIDLQDFSIGIISFTRDTEERFDFKETIPAHLEAMTEAMDGIIEKSISTLFGGKEKQASDFTDRLEDARIIAVGGIVIPATENSEKVVITYTRSKHQDS